MGVMDETDALLLVERALTPEAREKLLANVVRDNPHLDGAKVADVLEQYTATDSHLGFIEPWWERRGDRLAEEMQGSGRLLGVAVRAALLLRDWTPDGGGRLLADELAERVARAAFAGEEGVVALS